MARLSNQNSEKADLAQWNEIDENDSKTEHGENKMKNQLIKIVTLGALVAAVAAPTFASAETYREHKVEVRNTWKDLTIGSAVIGLAGLASGNRDVAIAGAVGTVYSAYRLNADNCDHRRTIIVEPVRFHDRDWDRRRERDRDRDCDRDRSHR